MKITTDLDEYIDNWRGLRDMVCFVLFDMLIATLILSLLALALLPLVFMCIIGWVPSIGMNIFKYFEEIDDDETNSK